jgi:hypothetical protein
MQSRTYNNGTILEYFFNVVPVNGATQRQNVFIDISTGLQINPKTVRLQLDYGSEDTFKGSCCTVFEESCEGWITDTSATWVTEDGSCWAFDL